MARAAVLGRLIRQVAEVVAVIAETPLVETIAFDVHERPGHRAGQHCTLTVTV